MLLPCNEFMMYHSEAAIMRLENALTLADVILGGGKVIAKGIIERYGPPPSKESTKMADFKRGVKKRARQGVEDMQRRTLTAVLLKGTEDEYVKGLLDTPSLSKDRVEEIVKEMERVRTRLQAKGQLPQ